MFSDERIIQLLEVIAASLVHISGQLNALITTQADPDSAALPALTAALKTSADSLAAVVAANTPAPV